MYKQRQIKADTGEWHEDKSTGNVLDKYSPVDSSALIEKCSISSQWDY